VWCGEYEAMVEDVESLILCFSNFIFLNMSFKKALLVGLATLILMTVLWFLLFRVLRGVSNETPSSSSSYSGLDEVMQDGNLPSKKLENIKEVKNVTFGYPYSVTIPNNWEFQFTGSEDNYFYLDKNGDKSNPDFISGLLVQFIPSELSVEDGMSDLVEDYRKRGFRSEKVSRITVNGKNSYLYLSTKGNGNRFYYTVSSMYNTLAPKGKQQQMVILILNPGNSGMVGSEAKGIIESFKVGG